MRGNRGEGGGGEERGGSVTREGHGGGGTDGRRGPGGRQKVKRKRSKLAGWAAMSRRGWASRSGSTHRNPLGGQGAPVEFRHRKRGLLGDLKMMLK